MKSIFVWCTHPLDQEKVDKYIMSNNFINNINFQQIPKNISINDVCEFLITNKAWALIHKNEHGVLHCTREWINLTNQCLKHNIPVLSFDLGYFDHYQSFMVDYYLENCLSSIRHEWQTISEEVAKEKIPNCITTHIEKILNKVNFYKNQQAPLNLENFVVIWGQWSTDLIKESFFLNKTDKKILMNEWLEELVPLIKNHGFTPVIKASPVKNLQHYQKIQHQARVFVDRKNHLEELENAHYLNDINYQLIAHAKYHIINCSSVSNELFINNCKVIAMGKSWFNDLGIFYEPDNWSNILNYREPSLINKNKWFNWWLKRQCGLLELPEKIIELRNSINQS